MGLLRDAVSGFVQQGVNQYQNPSGPNHNCRATQYGYNNAGPEMYGNTSYSFGGSGSDNRPTYSTTTSSSFYAPSPNSRDLQDMHPHPARQRQPAHQRNAPPLPQRRRSSQRKFLNPVVENQPDPYPSAPPQYYQYDQPASQCTEEDESSSVYQGYDDAPCAAPNLTVPLALPQTDFGKGVPFLGGYCSELECLGIAQRDFIRFVDELNASEIPNPEMALAGKAMGLASWFVPGVGSTILSVAQIGTQVGSGIQLSSATTGILAQGNARLFKPVGLEVVICSTQDVNNMVGCNPRSGQGFGSYYSPFVQGSQVGGGYMRGDAYGNGDLGGNVAALQRQGWMPRLQAYGDLLAPLAITLLSLQNPTGRTDISAQLGQTKTVG